MHRDEEELRARADFAYAASYAGFVGSAVIAVFFLIRDAVLGTPLLTPSLFATAIFDGRIPSGDVVVSLEKVALVSLVHVTLLSSVGAGFAYLIHRVDALLDHPAMMAVGLFAALGTGIVSLDVLFTPGLIVATGPVAVTLANAVTAVAMTVFYRNAFYHDPLRSKARHR